MPLPPKLRSNWNALSQLLDEALALPPERRAAFVDSLSGERAQLRDTLRQLLEHADAVGTSDFMATLPQFTQTAARGALADLASGDTIGPYRLLHELGAGGMGSVWLAERADGTLKRKIALKLPRLTWAKGLAERLARERDILASLEHPHIARLYDAGLDHLGRPYLALEYVDGQPIDVYAQQRGWSVRRKLDLLLQVCAAVAFAHSRLVVHRDLKPSNILVTEDGQVRLLDFGIAKLIEGDTAHGTQLTQLGARALTPDYASPEQIRGDPIGTVSDVYSLGVVAYELLAGSKPYKLKRGSVAELEEAIATSDAVPASVAASDIRTREALRGDLDAILNKALKKNPADRYVTVDALAQEFIRYANNEPVQAQPDAFAYRAGKFVRRHRIGVSLGAMAALALGVGVGTIAWLSHEATQQRDFALRRLSHAEAVNDLNAFLLYDATPSGTPITIGGLMKRAEQLAGNEHAGSTANRVAMLVAIGAGYIEHEKHEQARAVLQRAVELAENLPDPALRAVAFCGWGYVLSRDGHHAQARELVEEQLRRLPAQSAFALARVECLRRLAEIARHGNDGAAAVRSMEAARDALSIVPLRLPLRELAVLTQLGSAYRLADRQREAIAVFEEAYQLLSLLGREDTEQASTLLNEWGNALSNVGRPAAAEPLFRRAVELASSAADADGVSPAVLNNLGRVQLQLGHHDAALASAERGHARALGSGDNYGLMNLGVLRVQVHLARQELSLAAQALDETEVLATRVAAPKHVLHAICLMLRGDLAQAHGDLASALAFYDRAAGFQYSGSVRTLATVFVKRSAVLVALHRPTEAVRDAREGLQLRQSTLEPGWRSIEIGSAQSALGEALRAQANPTAARAAFAEAETHFAASLGDGHPRTQAARRAALE